MRFVFLSIIFPKRETAMLCLIKISVSLASSRALWSQAWWLVIGGLLLINTGPVPQLTSLSFAVIYWWFPNQAEDSAHMVLSAVYNKVRPSTSQDLNSAQSLHRSHSINDSTWMKGEKLLATISMKVWMIIQVIKGTSGYKGYSSHKAIQFWLWSQIYIIHGCIVYIHVSSSCVANHILLREGVQKKLLFSMR